MNQRVGDLAGNAAAILAMRAAAAAQGADLVVTPEMQLTGYPVEDLVLKPEFVRRTLEANERLIDATADGGPALLFGTLHQADGLVYNAVLLAEGGTLVGRTLKHELPNYGTFDEKRIFAAGPLPQPIEWRGVKLGVPICEDIWLQPVCAALADAGAEILLVPNGSPFELDKEDVRLRLALARVTETGLPLAYVNRVGGQDEIVFDGSSFVVNDDGQVVVRMTDWDEALLVTDWARGANGWRCETHSVAALDPFPHDTYHAMMTGLRDYVDDNGFPGVILGMSGGIDSALSAAVAVDALGPDVGGVVRARSLAKRLDNAPLAIVDKRRERAGESEVMNIIGEVEGHCCILIDDIIDSGGTLCNAAAALKDQGATDVMAYCSHGVLSGAAEARINASVLTELVVTDTIYREGLSDGGKIRRLTIAPLFGEAIHRIADESSVSSLFD